MPRKRKPFIDKKNSVTFHLVHRSQKDPLVADGDAPKHVLVEKSTVFEQKPRASSKAEDVDKRKEEQRKYGVYFDDEYDYLQHLKDSGEVYFEQVEGFTPKRPDLAAVFENKETTKGNLKLPSSVFPSEVEDKIGVLHRAVPVKGPRPELDPDVLEALESDFSDCEDSEGSFDDDFVSKANVGLSKSDASDEYESASDGYSENGSDFEGKEYSFDKEETKSRFTNYSMSSSVMRRNEGLTLIDDCFERIFEEYDEDQIGALDGEDIDGYLKPGDALLENVIEKFKKEQAITDLTDAREKVRDYSKTCSMEEEEMEDDIWSVSSEKNEDELEKIFIDKPTEKWDCESIISTYSTLYNHPKLIKEPPKPKPIKISARTGLPLNVLNSSGLTAANLKALDLSTGGTPYTPPSERSVAVSIRVKGETPEERRERKKVVKEQRKERRVEKKANTIAFKEEKKRQEKIMLNLQQNLKGFKIG